MKTYARIDGDVVAELFTTDGDIGEMFHPSLVWMEVTGLEPRPGEGWGLRDGVFSAPQPAVATATQILTLRDERLAQAAIRIAPLEDAVSLGIATSDDEAALVAWRKYRVAWNRIEQQPGFPVQIDLPVAPS